MSTKTITITDPTDLRPGDTATLASDELGAKITATTTDVQRDDVIQPPVTTIYLTLGVMGHSTPINVSKGGSWEFVSATREEPEWKPGTVAVVSYPKYMGDGDTLDARAVLGSNGWHPFEDPTDVITPDEVEDVRPLVVIDPATARKAVVDALATVLPSATVDYELLNAATDAVVATLGIRSGGAR